MSIQLALADTVMISGLVFVTLFTQGAAPPFVLVTSGVVQDGHCMLPLPAESPREFAKVKTLSVVVGLTLGGRCCCCSDGDGNSDVGSGP